MSLMIDMTSVEQPLYKLVGTYEWRVQAGNWPRVVRAEIFAYSGQQRVFRARVWLEENYNLYPTALNTDAKGNFIQKIYSSDVVNREITHLLSGADEFFSGGTISSEEGFLKIVISSVAEFLGELKGDE